MPAAGAAAEPGVPTPRDTCVCEHLPSLSVSPSATAATLGSVQQIVIDSSAGDELFCYYGGFLLACGALGLIGILTAAR